MHITFSSRAARESRAALEELLFFNPRQFRVRDGIVSSLQEFGHPRLEETANGLVILVGDQEAQTLFAYDRDRPGQEPVGVVVFQRTSPGEIAVIHVAVHPDYAMQSRAAGLGLGIALVEKVKEIASRIVGVKQIAFFYRREVVIKC
jgi:ribosomal protein S18 acetylase RimI-like enzyme